jgi:hypothetical protein
LKNAFAKDSRRQGSSREMPDALIPCRGGDLTGKFREQRCREDAEKSLPEQKAKTFILKGGMLVGSIERT